MKKNKICPIPFRQFFLQSSGDVFPCGHLQGTNEVLGNVQDRPLIDIWKGIEAQGFRQRHLNGECSACAHNQKLFGCHIQNEDYDSSTLPYKTKIDTPPSRIDFMVDSKCNIECIMCTNVHEKRGGFDNNNFWGEQNRELLSQVDEIEVIGGEPFITPIFFRLIDFVLPVNPCCRWKITTNGHYKLTQNLKEKLTRLNIVNLGFSIDSLRTETFEVIRKGGNLSLALSTLDDYIEFSHSLGDRKFKIDCNVVIQQKNALEAKSFCEFAREKHLGLHFILLKNPLDHSLLNIEMDKRDIIFERYLNEIGHSFHPALLQLILKLSQHVSPQLALWGVDEVLKAVERR